MKKVIKICDSCEKQMTDEQRDTVTIGQNVEVRVGDYSEVTTNKTKLDACPECMNKIKEMFHLAT